MTARRADYPDLAQAACAGSDSAAWFPQEGQASKDTQMAVRVCLGCPVRAECLAWALEHNERFGIWGGLSVQQRDDLKAGRAPRARKRAS